MMSPCTHVTGKELPYTRIRILNKLWSVNGVGGYRVTTLVNR